MAVDLVRRHRLDVAVLDLAMPPPGGHAAVRAVKRAHPKVRVLALSDVTDDQRRLWLAIARGDSTDEWIVSQRTAGPRSDPGLPAVGHVDATVEEGPP